MCFVYSVHSTSHIFQAIKFTIGLRLSEEEEKAGADWAEHKIGLGPETEIYGSVHHVTRSAMSYHNRPRSALSMRSTGSDISDITDTADNTNLVFRRFNNNHSAKKDKVTPINIPCPNNKQDNTTISIASFI